MSRPDAVVGRQRVPSATRRHRRGASGARVFGGAAPPRRSRRRARAVSASNWRALADGAPTPRAAVRVCVDAPDLENMLLLPAGVKYKPARSAVKVPLARSASATRFGAGKACALRANRCACVGERVPDSATSLNARCPGVVNEHALSTNRSARCRAAVRQLLDREVVAVTPPAARAILPDAVFHADAVVHEDAPTRPERDCQVTVWPFPRSIRGSNWNFQTSPILLAGPTCRGRPVEAMLPSLWAGCGASATA